MIELTADNQQTVQNEPPPGHDFPLGVNGFTYADLYRPPRLRELAETFYREVAAADPGLAQEFSGYRAACGVGYADREESDLIIKLAPYLSRFLARLFKIETECEQLTAATINQQDIFEFKKSFIQKRVFKKFTTENLAAWDLAQLDRAVCELRQAAFPRTISLDGELAAARMVVALMSLEKEYELHLGPKRVPLSEANRRAVATLESTLAGCEALRGYYPAEPGLTAERREQKLVQRLLELFEQWAFAQYHLAPQRVESWVSYRQPHALDYERLVQIESPRPTFPELLKGSDSHLRQRDGFKLTDSRYTGREVLNEVHYCIYCHERDKDSCSKGFQEKDGTYRKNPLGIPLNGCPLEEKISEMHLLKKGGDSIAALATLMIDNPMCPGTGHRICNDCMKSCIFQKQEPVNIPQAETGILTDVLNLPYGFEVYALLTRWNPLNVKRPYALPYNGKNVLVVGLGPAGYTLAHYLLNDGFGVVGIDALKVEPLPTELIGGADTPPRPVRDIREFQTQLDERVLAGFGGVSEYGITVRWDKNFLAMIHLTLRRRDKFLVYGGVRFGGTITIEDAWNLDFDHIAMATGAGKPTVVPMKRNLIRGIRKASDFLMALQLTGAFKREAMANLQVQLPALVIGGGLTAVDAATELMAYYPVQVEKVLERFETLGTHFGEERIWKVYDEEERQIFGTFIEHGRAIRAERERAHGEGRKPDFVKLIREWGGVSILYRKGLVDSPAYRLNHEEVIKSLEEGIYFVERMSPVEAIPDDFGAVAAVRFERMLQDDKGKWQSSAEYVTLPGKTVCVAAGTSPNIIYEKERPGTFKLDRRNEFFAGYKTVNHGDGKFQLEPSDQGELAFFTSYENNGRFITYYGDNHPAYAGNVVKAMASAKLGYPQVVKLFEAELAKLDPSDQPTREEAFRRLARRLASVLSPTVVQVERLTPTIAEVIVKAPYAAERFHPGQFYRLQNYEVNSYRIAGTKLTMEGLALTGAWVDKEQGLLSLIVLELGASSRLCAVLRPGDPVVVMGPTGAPTAIPRGETVLLAGGGLGNAVLFSIGRALRENGNRVLYFAGYRRGEDLYKQADVEGCSDQVVWSTDAGREIEPRRTQDCHFRGNIVQAMKAYAEGQLGTPLFGLKEVDRVIAIGSDRMMAAVKTARRAGGVLGPYFRPDHVAIGSINSPMQCMMKEVCAQCLQKHIDPQTGEETRPVFSCFNQDQRLDEVDFQNLSDRLRANTVQEKMANLWLDYLLETQPIERV
jgi:NADPH-dependent glutamate synthase beta subunit-like oxidoreductase/NAD(P)H-flavin reductase